MSLSDQSAVAREGARAGAGWLAGTATRGCSGGLRTLMAWGLLGCSAPALAQQLPPGPGREVLVEACVQCHDLDPVLSQAKPVAAWQRSVDEMIWRGAPLLPGERERLVDYLARHFSEPGARPPAPGAAADAGSLPPGAGRAILVRACVACHDLGLTLAARKDEAGWRRTLELMVALGTRLGGLDQELLVDYLAEHLGAEP